MGWNTTPLYHKHELYPLSCKWPRVKHSDTLQMYTATSEKVENKIIFAKKKVECRQSILSGNSDAVPLPHCRTGAEWEGNNGPGQRARVFLLSSYHLLVGHLSGRFPDILPHVLYAFLVFPNGKL
jgi:hypothetical protein